MTAANQLKKHNMSNPPFKFSIIIPAYNEEKTIDTVIKEIQEHLNDLSSRQYEIIIVNDASKDQTASILKKHPNIKLLHHPHNKGYGASLKTGILEARYDWVLIIDSDGTYPVKAISELIKIAKKSKCSLVIGSRDKNNKAIPPERRHAKRFLNKFAGYLTGIPVPDINSGLRLFKKEIALNHWELFPERFSFTSTLTMIGLSKGYHVKFTPIDYYKRKARSTLKPTDFFNFLKLLTKLSLFFKPIKVFVPLSLFIFLLAILVLFSFLMGWTDKFFDSTFIVLCATALQTLFFGLLAEIITHTRK